MRDTLITLHDVSKSYPKVSSSSGRYAALKAAFLNRPYQETYDIIKHINLTVNRGESLGIIGENGAGKSTLLKLISGVLQPSEGKVSVNCRMAALLELGAGFHPEYSGIENIRMNAALSGLSRRELQGKMQQVIDFADIGDYIDEPIKHYSSGMVVRLGFAMMTALEPELLITDEVLAVGDESFQKKCITWMQDYLHQGGTLLLCSHGMYHVQKLCAKAIWIDNGEIRQYGQSSHVTQAYVNFHERKNAVKTVNKSPGEGLYYVSKAAVYDEHDDVISVANYRQTFYVKGTIYSPDEREPTVAVGIDKIDGTPIFGIASSMTNGRLKKITANLFAFCIEYPNCAVLPGELLIKVHAMDPEALRLFDTYEITLSIQGDALALGNVYLEHQWHY